MNLRDTLTNLKNAMVEIRALEAESRAAVSTLELVLAYLEKSQDESAKSRAAQVRKSMSETFQNLNIIANSDNCEAQLEALAKLIGEVEEQQGRERAALDDFYHNALIIGLPELQSIAKGLRDKIVRIETLREIGRAHV